MIGIAERNRKLRHRVGPFLRAVRHGDEIGGRQMALAVCRIGAQG